MNISRRAARYGLPLVMSILVTACGSEPDDRASRTEREAQGNAGTESSTMPEPVPGAPSPVVTTENDAAASPPAEPAAPETPEAAMNAAAPDTVPATGDGNPCERAIEVGDSIAYSVTEITVPSSCGEVTVELTHTGRLPASAMGHNWVLVPADALQSVAQAGASAGLAADYLPANDDRIIAASRLIGGGETDRVTFSLDKLENGTDYMYVCTVPGHWMVMQGTFEVSR